MVRSPSIVVPGVFREVPAALSATRLIVLPWLPHQAHRGRRRRVSQVQIAMIGIDVIDGMLARRIGHQDALRRQRRLDGLADLGLFVIAPWCAYTLSPEIAGEQRTGLACLAGAQLVNVLTCRWRFGCLPRYHTELFRWSAGGMGLMLALRLQSRSFAGPLRLAIGLHILAHLEAVAISWRLQTYRDPIGGLWQLQHASIS